MIDAEALRKIALFGSIPESAVFCSYNVESIYQVPLILDRQGMGDFICQRFGYKCSGADFGEWQQVVDAILKPEHEVSYLWKICGLSDSYVTLAKPCVMAPQLGERGCISYLG
jgi:CTP synthase